MTVIEVRDQSQWSEITLSKRSLNWYKDMNKRFANDNRFNWDEPIERETNLIRSFMKTIKDQIAA